MTQIEAALTYVAGDTPAATHVAYLHHHPLTNTLFISAKSSIGTCWYLREIDGAALSSPPILRAASPTCRCIPRSGDRFLARPRSPRLASADARPHPPPRRSSMCTSRGRCASRPSASSRREWAGRSRPGSWTAGGGSRASTTSSRSTRRCARCLEPPKTSDGSPTSSARTRPAPASGTPRSCSPRATTPRLGDDWFGPIEAVLDGLEAGRRDFGVTAMLAPDLVRDAELEAAERSLEVALRFAGRGVVALNAAGSERSGSLHSAPCSGVPRTAGSIRAARR